MLIQYGRKHPKYEYCQRAFFEMTTVHSYCFTMINAHRKTKKSVVLAVTYGRQLSFKQAWL